MVKIKAWPDGTWITEEEYSENLHKFLGDDYHTFPVPLEFSEEMIDVLAKQVADGIDPEEAVFKMKYGG